MKKIFIILLFTIFNFSISISAEGVKELESPDVEILEKPRVISTKKKDFFHITTTWEYSNRTLRDGKIFRKEGVSYRETSENFAPNALMLFPAIVLVLFSYLTLSFTTKRKRITGKAMPYEIFSSYVSLTMTAFASVLLGISSLFMLFAFPTTEKFHGLMSLGLVLFSLFIFLGCFFSGFTRKVEKEAGDLMFFIKSLFLLLLIYIFVWAFFF